MKPTTIWTVIHQIDPESELYWEGSPAKEPQLFTNSAAAYAYAIQCYLENCPPLSRYKPAIQQFLVGCRIEYLCQHYWTQHRQSSK